MEDHPCATAGRHVCQYVPGCVAFAAEELREIREYLEPWTHHDHWYPIGERRCGFTVDLGRCPTVARTQRG